jgi:hypothetical protein
MVKDSKLKYYYNQTTSVSIKYNQTTSVYKTDRYTGNKYKKRKSGVELAFPNDSTVHLTQR